MRAEKNFLYKIYQLLGKLSILLSVAEGHSGAVDQSRDGMGEVVSSILLHVGFFSVTTFCQKDVVGITRHVVTTISAFSFTMLLLDRILTHIVNHISNTSYHLQYLYCQGGYVFGTKPNLITCVGYIFLSVAVSCLTYLLTHSCLSP
jgi:hypothetical protein